MESGMAVDTDVREDLEQNPTVEGEKIEEKRDFRSSFEQDIDEESMVEAWMVNEGTSLETSLAVADLYNLDISVAVTEIETEEVDSEFNDALREIEGKKSFPCSKCNKVCKSKGGLTKHTNSKHSDVVSAGSDETSRPLDEETVASIVQAIKTKLIEENLYGTDINTILSRDSVSSEALFKALLPLYETFCRKNDQDKLLQSFYGLIPQSCKLLNCKDFKIANLIMIHIPDHLVGFYNVGQTRNKEETTSKPIELDPAERGPLSYVAGYVVSKLFQTSRRKTDKRNQELEALLQNMKSSGPSSSFISARTRGGLVDPCDDLVRIVEEAEICFRKEVSHSKLSLRNIPTENICQTTLKLPIVKSLWGNIMLSSGVDQSSSTQKLCLENVIKLYLKVRSFSYARDYVTKYKIKEKKLKKMALRKDMKQSSTEKTI